MPMGPIQIQQASNKLGYNFVSYIPKLTQTARILHVVLKTGTRLDLIWCIDPIYAGYIDVITKLQNYCSQLVLTEVVFGLEQSHQKVKMESIDSCLVPSDLVLS